jgi:hypothetical protein
VGRRGGVWVRKSRMCSFNRFIGLSDCMRIDVSYLVWGCSAFLARMNEICLVSMEYHRLDGLDSVELPFPLLQSVMIL